MLPPPASMHARPRVACRPPPSLTSRCGLRPGQITVLEASVIVIPEHHKATQDKPCGNMVGSKMTVTDTLRQQQHGPWWCVLKHRPRLNGATNDNDAAENQTFHHEGALKKEIPPKWGEGGEPRQRYLAGRHRITLRTRHVMRKVKVIMEYNTDLQLCLRRSSLALIGVVKTQSKRGTGGIRGAAPYKGCETRTPRPHTHTHSC